MILVLVLANRITIDKRLYITLWTTVLCVCVVCLFVWVCVCLYVCGFIYLCVCVSMYLPACAFAYLCLRVYAVTIVSLYEIKLKQSEANHAVSTSSKTLFEQLSQNLVQLAVWSLGKGRMQKTSQMVVWQWKRKESLGLIITGCWLSKKLKEICNTEVLTWFQKL